MARNEERLKKEVLQSLLTNNLKESISKYCEEHKQLKERNGLIYVSLSLAFVIVNGDGCFCEDDYQTIRSNETESLSSAASHHVA